MAEPKKVARRSFFAGLGLVAAAGAAAKLTPTAPLSTSDGANAQAEPQGKGYRLSEHIKKYYRTTTV